MKKCIVLMSPYPVDSYPPVRYQAELLARAGYRVELFTSPMQHESRVVFEHPGVHVRETSLGRKVSLGRRVVSRAQMAMSLLRFRLLYGSSILAEIGFDPVGVEMLLTVPRRNKNIVAHLHEALIFASADRPTRSMRRLLPKSSLVVVADADRARLLKEQFTELPEVITVRNVPMRQSVEFVRPLRTPQFSVAYFGAMGESQCLDSIIRSMPWWPKEATLHLYSKVNTSRIEAWRNLALEVGVESRVVFNGWVHADALLSTVSKHHLGFSMMRPLSVNERYASGASNKRFLLMAAGIAQVSDRLPGVPELIETQGIGRCVDPEDTRAIAEAVCYYYAAPQLLESICVKAQALISDSLNYETEFQSVMRYLRIVSGG